MKSKIIAEHYKRPSEHRAYLPAFGIFEREVRRFFAVPIQTIGSPIGSSLLYFYLFYFSIGRLAAQGGDEQLSLGINYIAFLIPGIMTLEMINAAFQNPVSSLMISKWSGTVIDQLIAPVTPFGVWAAYVGGAFVRICVVASATYLAGVIFSHTLPMENIFLLLLSGIIITCIFGSLGVIAGVLFKSWDQLTLITSFVLQPLIFLSGVFFSLQSMPEKLAWISKINPVFYVVNMTRHAVIGVGDCSALTAFFVSAAFAVISSCFAIKYANKLKF